MAADVAVEIPSAPADAVPSANGLRKVHSWASLTALGVGGIVGAGIFFMAGMAASVAGPAIMVSFLIAGFACVTCALCYAELSSRVPSAGGSYAFARATYGDRIGWLFGWNIVLCFAMSAASVASGWSRYVQSLLTAGGASLPPALREVPLGFGANGPTWTGGVVDLPALLIALAITAIAVRGIRTGVAMNGAVLAIKLLVLGLFVGIGATVIHPENWQPFAPLGWGAAFSGDGRPPTGMLAGAAMVFYAYLGFESIASHVEEAKNPSRDGAIATVAAVVIASLIYISVIAVLTGMTPFRQIDQDAPLSEAFRLAGLPWAANLIAIGAVAAITNVLLVIILTLARILMALGRDGMLPTALSRIHPTHRSPFVATLTVGVIAALFGAWVPLRVLADVLTMGMLLNFAGVALAVLILRRRSQKPAAFQAPFGPIVPVAAIAVCCLLGASLSPHSIGWVLVWAVAGLIVFQASATRAARS